MTQNKTALQKAYSDLIGLSGATYDDTERANKAYASVLIFHMSTILDALKAAQAYADLPEKIEGLRRGRQEDTLSQAKADGVNKAICDILNLLKEGG